MCLSANEPGGPRRCEGYMRTVHNKIVSLQQNLDLQKAREEQINDARKRIAQIDGMDKSRLTNKDRQAYDRLRKTLATQMDSFTSELSQLKAEEPNLKKTATTALESHKAEMDRRQRMGAVISENKNAQIDEEKPYLSVNLEHYYQLKRVLDKHEANGTPVDYKMRTRMLPVYLGKGAYHPFLTVPAIDLQFDDLQTQEKYGVSDTNWSMGHYESEKWFAPTDKVLQAAYVVSDGGTNYVSQRNAESPENSTGGLVKDAVFSANNPSLVDDPPREISDLRMFARNYPGDTSYAAKVRAIAAKDYVSPKDVAVLASAISGWKQYRDKISMRNTPPRAKVEEPMHFPRRHGGWAEKSSATPARASAPQSNPSPRRQPGYVGRIGEQIDERQMEVKVVRKSISDYGGEIMTMIIAQDRDGNTFKWNASRDIIVDKGDKISMRGIVKDHVEYNNMKQTVLTRAELDILSRAPKTLY